MQNEFIVLKKLSSIPNIDITIPTMWLFINSMADNMNVSDIMIRYLVVKEFYDNYNSNEKDLLFDNRKKLNYEFIKNMGFPMMALYYKMQFKRSEYIKKVASINVEESVLNFIDLIDNVDKQGFNTIYPLEVNQNFCLLDGAHRLALALYHNIPKVKIFFNEGLNFTPDYSLEWFKSMGMDEYIAIINDTYKDILEKHNYIYIISSKDSIDKSRYDKFIIEEIKYDRQILEKFDFLNNFKYEISDKFYKLIPLLNNEVTLYPLYSEKINIPIIKNELEKNMIEFCNLNCICLMKQKGDINV